MPKSTTKRLQSKGNHANSQFAQCNIKLNELCIIKLQDEIRYCKITIIIIIQCNNQIHSQGSQRLSTSVSLYCSYCHFHFIINPTLARKSASIFFLMLIFWRLLNSNRQSKIYLHKFHKLNLEFSASRDDINFYRAYFRTAAAPVLSTFPSNHGFVTLSLLILSCDISLNPGPLRYPGEICGQAVRKTQRAIMCKECSVWFYQACSYIKDFNFKTLEKHPSYIRPCCNCGLTSFSSSMFSSGIATSNRFDTLSDFPSSSPWNPTGTQATSTYLFRLVFPLHLSSPSRQKTEQKKSD